jgi:predicted RNase H-like nuclease (RuvC/YqgF family)
MWRVAPDEVAYLRAENARLAAENLRLASRVEKLEDKVASRDEDLRFHSGWIETLRRLLEKNTERHREKSSDTQQRIEQLESGMVALQEANHLKEMQILKLRQEVNSMKEVFTCSISQDLMRSPCVLSSGQLYNRDHIVQWLRRSDQCPNTRVPVEFHDNFPPTCIALKEVCAILARI